MTTQMNNNSSEERYSHMNATSKERYSHMNNSIKSDEFFNLVDTLADCLCKANPDVRALRLNEYRVLIPEIVPILQYKLHESNGAEQ